MMEFEICLKNLLFYAYHGVLDEEKKIGNEFKVNLSVFVPCRMDIEKDCLDSTISYASLFEIIKEEMSKTRNLLEKVAFDIVEIIKERYPAIIRGKIEIEKIHPPIPGMLGSASVSLNF